jgi:hypothetical protein
MNKLNELARNLQSPLFATRDTIEDAFHYAHTVIEAIPASDRGAAYTALYVVVNTIAEEVKRLAEQDEEVLVNSDGQEIGRGI